MKPIGLYERIDESHQVCDRLFWRPSHHILDVLEGYLDIDESVFGPIYEWLLKKEG